MKKNLKFTILSIFIVLTFFASQISLPNAMEETTAMQGSIPDIAKGHEQIYQRFLNGKLIYKPNENNDIGKIELRISDLANPLEGTFDLSQCGDTGQHLNISTGYRKGKKAENANKFEIWLVPRFLIEKELNTTAKHFQGIYGDWNSNNAVGMFWTWGGWDNLGDYDYLIMENMDNLSKINLYQNWEKRRRPVHLFATDMVLKNFHVGFE